MTFRLVWPSRVPSLAWLLAAIALACPAERIEGQAPNDPAQLAAKILDDAQVPGGLVVHLGAGDGRLTAALRAVDSYQVQGLDRDAANVRKAREHIQSRGAYGDVSVDQLIGDRLPYIDNLINLVVVEDASGIPMSEVMRVLTPSGVAYVKQGANWQKTVKPRPENIDDWTHYLHSASGNAVAKDDVVGPPKHLQWLGSPRWSRHHDRMASMSALVSASGRIFYIMDEGSRISIQTPPKWTLIARDAFNGTILWQQPIDTWQNHLWPLKSGPTQLARRLVAIGDRVYCTLGIDAPLSALDAATGAVRHQFEDSAGTEEFVAHGDVLVALVNKGKRELAEYAPKFGVVGDQALVNREHGWNEEPRQVMAFDIKTGKRLWKLDTKCSPLSLAADGDSVFFHDAEQVVRLDRTTGKQIWRTAQAQRRSRFTFNFGTRLLVHNDVILFAGGDRTMRAYAKQDGKEMWNAPHAQSGYQSPEDLLVAGGLVWNAPTTRTQDTGVYVGRDPRTGETKVEFPPDVNTYWFHHRCYIAKATDNFIIPSRTGIEFVDLEKRNWNINHWVRGGCLYGVMPCNGLVYAPPHDCACYPEAKLYGMNALAPAVPSREIPAIASDEQRLIRGPAFGKIEAPREASAADWPTYRHDEGRSGSSASAVSANLQPAWEAKLGGKLSSVVIADGRLYVAQVDQHTLHALDANNGQTLWSFTTGGRVDSPPSIDRGRVIFGSADGSVYCLRATDGELAWRFRAAPADLRHTAFEQIESVWPVHGSVLIKDDRAYFVAGRSNFLDGGLRFIALKTDTGEKIHEVVIDEKDPETGANIQERLQVLQMPVGLADVLSSDGKSIYMRSQQFELDGKRLGLGPYSGQAPVHGAVQKGETAHLFAPMGFLDDTWFHRSYWVYGRSFAGGHNGYYQAGKYTPSGRILVADENNVYGFGRKPQYLRWTTTMEHQLFSASKKAADQALAAGEPQTQRAARRGEATNTNIIRFERKPSLSPANTPLAIMAWVNAEQPSGVVVSRGGPAVGYSLALTQGKPVWYVRTANDKVTSVTGPNNVVGGWVHLAGVLTRDKELQLYVNGRLAGSGKAPQLIATDPAQPLEVGGDEGGAVGEYSSPNKLLGTVDELRLYHGDLTADDIEGLASPDALSRRVNPRSASLRLYCSFDNGDAADESGNKNDGKLDGNRTTEGRIAGAVRFQGGGGPAGGADTFVQHQWTKDLPLLVRAMAKAGDVIFIAGPPDLIDEEETFQKLANKDPYVHVQLAQQNDAFDGKLGARLQAVSATDGKTLFEYHLNALPTWDGMATARGKLYLSTSSGSVHCFGAAR